MSNNSNVYTLCLAIKEAGGMPYLVGGAVRDAVLGLTIKDYDIEVFRLPGDQLERVIDDVPGVVSIDHVGAAFGVYKVTFDDGLVVDVSLPRTERKRGLGHRGFDVSPSPDMSPAEAVKRRDFTINALMMDPLKEGVYDLVNGINDIYSRTLRHVSDQFGEDPLRVLRGMQFASRFDMTMDPRTADVCEGLILEYGSLPVERVWGEWEKWSRGMHPARGLDVLNDTNWVLLYPELAALMVTPQDAQYHPEGNVWRHTRQAVNETARIAAQSSSSPETTTVLVFAALLHDIGKPKTTEVHDDGRVTSHGHAEEGVLIADMFLRKIGAPNHIRERVISLVGEHMWGVGGMTDRSVRRLARRLAARGNTVHDLALLMHADRDARAPLPKNGSAVASKLLVMASKLNVVDEGPKPILMGRHLVGRGYAPGPKMGGLLKCAFERQLDGEFNDLDGAIAWLATRKGCTHENP